MSRWIVDERWLCAASLVWVGVLSAKPALAEEPLFFWLTGAFITLNAIHSLRAITVRRRILVGLNCVQIVLFGFLNWQLARAFGDDHYRFDRDPWLLDWIEFTAAHVVRAADVFDTIDELGFVVQNITHASVASGMILIAMHLTVDAFLIGLALRWANRIWHEPPHDTWLAQGRREAAWLCVTALVFIAFVVCVRMRPLDWLLWPLDNLVRLIDVGDILQVSRTRLHGVETSILATAGGLIFRLVAGVWMTRLILFGRFWLMRSWGLSIDTLIGLLGDPDAQMRRNAAEGLGWSGPGAWAPVEPLIESLRDPDAGVRRAAAWALGQIGPPAGRSTPHLVELAWRDVREVRLTALDALGRMGPAARAALHDLVHLGKAADAKTRAAAALAVRRIAPGLAEKFEREVIRPRRKQRRRPSRQARRDAAWQRSLQAAETRRRREEAITAHLTALLREGFFAQERDAHALCAALAARGETVEPRLLMRPLLRLSVCHALRRARRGDQWVYVT